MIKVLIVDDSALIRNLLAEILSSDPEIEVVGVAQDPHIAREKIKQLNPDVLTLDVEMPRMDGVTFLRNLMRLRPMPVVMISSLTEAGADVTLRALELGAVDFVTKPAIDVSANLGNYAEEIIRKIKIAARARVRALDSSAAKTVTKVAPREAFRTTDKIIAIGASTGGTEAIREVLEKMPSDGPGILIAQHIPPAFSARFAARLDATCAMTVREASDGEQILNGHAYVAPGTHHLLLRRNGARYMTMLSDAPPVQQHRPSVDVLFDSVAEQCGINAIGLILTGMGADGAEGLLKMRNAGAHTIAQDEATSVVWGMPGEAVKRQAAVEVAPLSRLAGLLCERLGTSENRAYGT